MVVVVMVVVMVFMFVLMIVLMFGVWGEMGASYGAVCGLLGPLLRRGLMDILGFLATSLNSVGIKPSGCVGG